MLGISGFKDAGAWYAAIHILAIMGLEELEVDMPLVNCVRLTRIAVAVIATERSCRLPSRAACKDISMQESWPRAGPEDRVELCGICILAALSGSIDQDRSL